jgi:hypothetical protein
MSPCRTMAMLESDPWTRDTSGFLWWLGPQARVLVAVIGLGAVWVLEGATRAAGGKKWVFGSIILLGVMAFAMPKDSFTLCPIRIGAECSATGRASQHLFFVVVDLLIVAALLSIPQKAARRPYVVAVATLVSLILITATTHIAISD